MLDTLIRGATVLDGTGSAGTTADVGIQDGCIVEIGRITQAAHQTIDADGALVTPGFVDIHTHYDGQTSWDETFSPSIFHGTTTVVMGNCGVGFAPVRPGEQDRLIRLMEGVEEIPGAALAEGIKWQWESFEQYMDALEAGPHSLNFMNLVPHDCLRYYVMGERAARLEVATPQDLAHMQSLLHTALKAGAIGFSTGRSDNHRTSRGEETPACIAADAELQSLASAFKNLPYRVLHAVNDFDAMQGDPEQAKARFNAEYARMEAMARQAGRPLALTWLERLNAPPQWQWLATAAEQSLAQGLDIKLQTATRAIGVLSGLDTSFCVLTPFASYQQHMAHLPVAERAAALRDPAFRTALLAEKRLSLADGHSAIPPIVDHIMANLDQTAMLMFPFEADSQGNMNYEPDPRTSFGAQAKARGLGALAVLYDYLAAGDGQNLVYFPIFNYLRGSLATVQSMLAHPQALVALGDAGAHVGTVCDASSTTTFLSRCAQSGSSGGGGVDPNTISLAQAVHMLTQRNGTHLGLCGPNSASGSRQRGVLAVGAAADINVIDLQKLAATRPRMVRDLPAGGKRLIQGANGYLATLVAGQVVCANGQVSEARPGRLIRAS